jgi:hypothetical protein
MIIKNAAMYLTIDIYSNSPIFGHAVITHGWKKKEEKNCIKKKRIIFYNI